MIRKTIIVVLMLGAVASCVVFLLSEHRWFGYALCEYHGIASEDPVTGRTVYLYRYNAVYAGCGEVLLLDMTLDTNGRECFPGWHWVGSGCAEYRFFRLPRYSNRLSQRKLTLPFWVPILVFATYPTIAFIRGPLLRRRRRRKGLCIVCGYDLTGNVSGVCSECGTEIDHP
ncbi:MAG: hypothetical protein JSU63_11765 [Phycisphaerales bacterium]|nr:MAG: hypothetical protein JSU63_11765 [Phycisphaerales bacterium]